MVGRRVSWRSSQGVGYPNADFSHFNSMAYWMAGQVGGIPSTGWLGRWLDGYVGGGPRSVRRGRGRLLRAAAPDRRQPARHGRADQQAGVSAPAPTPATCRCTRRCATCGPRPMAPWHAAVGQAFVDQLDLAATLAGHYPADDALPDTEIVAGLEIAARMINANLGFRVLTVGFGDFDSHANQPEMHTSRMQELNDAIARFYAIAQPGVVEPRDGHDVLRVRTHELGQRRPGHRSRIVGAALRARSERQGRSVRRSGRRWQGSTAGSGWASRRLPLVLRVDHRRLARRRVDRGARAARSRTSGCSPAARAQPRRIGVAATGGRHAAVLLRARQPVPAGRHARRHGRRAGPAARSGRVDPRADCRSRRGPPTAARRSPSMSRRSTCRNRTSSPSIPGGTARPFTSNLNAGPGRPVPNLVVMGVGSDGSIEVFNSNGTAHCLVDVFGYFSRPPATASRRCRRAPVRHTDGSGYPAGKVPNEHADRRPGHGARPACREFGASAVVHEPHRDRDRVGGLDAVHAGRPGRGRRRRTSTSARGPRSQSRDLQDRRRRADHDRRARHRRPRASATCSGTSVPTVAGSARSHRRACSTPATGVGAGRRPVGPGRRSGSSSAVRPGAGRSRRGRAQRDRDQRLGPVVRDGVAGRRVTARHQQPQRHHRPHDRQPRDLPSGRRRRAGLASPVAACDLIADVMGYFAD